MKTLNFISKNTRSSDQSFTVNDNKTSSGENTAYILTVTSVTEKKVVIQSCYSRHHGIFLSI